MAVTRIVPKAKNKLDVQPVSVVIEALIEAAKAKGNLASLTLEDVAAKVDSVKSKKPK